MCVHKQRTLTDFSAMNASHLENLPFVKGVLEAALETRSFTVSKWITILNKQYKNEFILSICETIELVWY